MTTIEITRTLTVDVVHNVRHLGGHPTASGRRTGAVDIIRSASLGRLEPAGIEALAAAGVRTVVDLRSSEELKNVPTPDITTHGITTVHAPVFERDASPGAIAEQEQEFPGYAVYYRRFLDTGRNAYKTLFEVIAGGGGVLYHCMAGKDRTGVATLLLLDLASVPEEYIVADYHLTERELLPLRAEWEPRMAERGITPERAAQLLGAPEAEMWSTIDYLRGRWGSAAGYLTDIGVSRADIAAARARLHSSVLE